MRIYLFFSSLLVLACTNPPDEKVMPAKAQAAYFYYPRANVYYDSANKEYLFVAADGRTWQTQSAVPSAMQAIMDKRVFIEHPSQPVWKDNASHKLVYAALLYASPSDTALPKKAPPVPVITLPQIDTVQKKEHKGVRRFLDKIFGRKKQQVRSDVEGF